MEEILALKFAVLHAELNERQRRLWAAGEAMCLGRGGVSLVSRATGLSRTTLPLGLCELESGDPLTGHRVRREGGGRKKVKDTQPTL
ncbi:MAG: ISAzo13 family transposase, partial [Planctomycetaceae bacterium]|nr:ISAzo13 family transposase [Planctomycetaceae bacterium]